MDSTPAPQKKREVVQYTVKKAYYLDDCIALRERCLTVTPKNYKWELEGVPTGYKPTRLF